MNLINVCTSLKKEKQNYSTLVLASFPRTKPPAWLATSEVWNNSANFRYESNSLYYKSQCAKSASFGQQLKIGQVCYIMICAQFLRWCDDVKCGRGTTVDNLALFDANAFMLLRKSYTSWTGIHKSLGGIVRYFSKHFIPPIATDRQSWKIEDSLWKIGSTQQSATVPPEPTPQLQYQEPKCWKFLQAGVADQPTILAQCSDITIQCSNRI